MAARLSQEFGGRLRISYAGGADAFNIDKLFSLGIWPITMATTELKPGGYNRLAQTRRQVDQLTYRPLHRRGSLQAGRPALPSLSPTATSEAHQATPRRKLEEKVPLIDCFTAPCHSGCPIHQDIPAYLKLCLNGPI